MELDRAPLEGMLLSVLEKGPAHGYAVIERLRDRSDGDFDLAEGTVYPALHRLERSGLLGSRWTEVGGRRRRTYSLTRRGRTQLAKRRAEWRAYAGAVQAVIG
ncbi:MAG: helix-turn-helix transcriptional regulator [Actinobacteria bacterium]|nr:helix-turn-helix transcriptional regulator [Actinomycetota bacterium]